MRGDASGRARISAQTQGDDDDDVQMGSLAAVRESGETEREPGIAEERVAPRRARACVQIYIKRERNVLSKSPFLSRPGWCGTQG